MLPIVTALSRDVFDQTPATHKEGALALGATKWEMIRTSVLPFGRPGVISAAMLGIAAGRHPGPLVRADAAALPFADGALAAVYAVWVFHVVGDAGAVRREPVEAQVSRISTYRSGMQCFR